MTNITTKNNVIEQVGGIDRAREIVSGAPESSQFWRDMDCVFSPNEILYYAWFGGALLVFEDGKGWVKSIYHDENDYILDQLQNLNDLRTVIEHHYYGRSEAEELEAYAELSQEKIEGGAGLRGNFSKALDCAEQLIASHDKDHCEHEWNDLTSNGDKYRFLVCKHCDSTQNYLPLDDSREFKVGDLVVHLKFDNKKIYEIRKIKDDLFTVFYERNSHSFRSDVRHATPAEIAAGHRIDGEMKG